MIGGQTGTKRYVFGQKKYDLVQQIDEKPQIVRHRADKTADQRAQKNLYDFAGADVALQIGSEHASVTLHRVLQHPRRLIAMHPYSLSPKLHVTRRLGICMQNSEKMQISDWLLRYYVLRKGCRVLSLSVAALPGHCDNVGWSVVAKPVSMDTLPVGFGSRLPMHENTMVMVIAER
jgi:hypothetical protein